MKLDDEGKERVGSELATEQLVKRLRSPNGAEKG